MEPDGQNGTKIGGVSVRPRRDGHCAPLQSPSGSPQKSPASEVTVLLRSEGTIGQDRSFPSSLVLPAGAVMLLHPVGRDMVRVTTNTAEPPPMPRTTLEGASLAAVRCRELGSPLRLGGVPWCFGTPLRTVLLVALVTGTVGTLFEVAHSPRSPLVAIAVAFVIAMAFITNANRIDVTAPPTWRVEGNRLVVERADDGPDCFCSPGGPSAIRSVFNSYFAGSRPPDRGPERPPGGDPP